MSRKYTQKEIINKIKKKNGKLLSIYIDYHTKISIQCNKCKHIWSAMPADLFGKKRSTWCPNCNGGLRLKIEDVKAIIESKKDLLLSKTYLNARTKLKIKCLICNKIRWQTYDKIKQGRRCIFCAGKIKKTLKQVAKYGKLFGFKLLSKKYINARTPLSWLCSEGHKIKKSISALKEGICSICNINHSYSQDKLFKIIKEIFYKFDISNNYRGFAWLKYKKRQEIDIFVHDIKLAIEYNGKQHYSPIKLFGGLKSFNYSKKRDKNKYYLIKKHKDEIKYFIKIKYTTKLTKENIINILKKHNIPIPRRR